MNVNEFEAIKNKLRIYVCKLCSVQGTTTAHANQKLMYD